MNTDISRRDFLKAVPVTAYALSQVAQGASLQPRPGGASLKIEPFDYVGVRLREVAGKSNTRPRATYISMSRMTTFSAVTAKRPG